MTAISTGREAGAHLCHRCGWPFPNPHPSAKHRRAHKKICGTIEGYKIIRSEEHGHHLAFSDVGHGLNEDERTPNPKALKKAVGEFGSSSSGIGAKSNISGDDVSSDAVTEFSDSGISPQLEERFESLRELDLSFEQKSFEADFGRSQTLYFDTTADITEQVNGPTRSAQGASVGVITGLQPDLVETGIARDDVAVDNISEYGNGKSLGEGHMNDKSPSISLESGESRIPDPALSADGSKEELCDNLDSDVVKHCQTEAHQCMDASAEISDSTKTVGESAPFVETRERDVSVRAEVFFYSNVDIVSIAADAINTSPEESLLSKLDGCMQASSSIFAPEQSEAKPVASSVDKEVELEIHVAGGDTIPGNSGPSEGGLSANENWNLEKYKDNFSVDTVACNAFECGDGDDRVSEKNIVSCSEENSICMNLGTTNEKGEGASVEVQSMVDPTNSADIPSSADAAQVKAKLNNHNCNDYEDCPSEQESSSMMKKCLNGADGAELTSFRDVVVDGGDESCAANTNSITIVHDGADVISTGVNSISLRTKADDELTSHKVGIAVMDLSANNSNSRSDSLEVNCGSVSEIEMVNNNESEGRRKNEETTAKVSPMKRYASLKKLLDEEVTLPNASHVKAESDGSKVDEKDTQVKGVEKWNSVARSSTEVKKEKRKGKSYWIPFVCCSSVHERSMNTS